MVDQVHKCFGCGACSVTCPHQAVSIVLNDEGYWRPRVQANCSKCGKCLAICPAVHHSEMNAIDANSLIMAVQAKPLAEGSSSGGAGHVLAQTALDAGIPVCGVGYNAQHERAEHVLVLEAASLGSIQGSKYIPSYTEKGFAQALKQECGVIFGTPCQMAGLDAALRKTGRRDRFTLVDIFCHGVPSQHLWANHIRGIRSKKNEAAPVQFRPQGQFCLQVGDYRRSAQVDPFYHLYLNQKVYQEACYQCPYRRASAADLRIGDYFDGAEGRWSLVVVNTEQGRQLLQEAGERLVQREARWSVVDAAQDKPQSKPVPAQREGMLQMLQQGQSPAQVMGKKKIMLQYVKGAVKAVLRKNKTGGEHR